MKLAELEELQSALERVPELVDLYENREFSFSEAVIEWLREIERVLRVMRSPLSSEVAILRGEVAAAEQGSPSAKVVLPPRATKRRTVAAVAFRSLERGQSAVMKSIDPALESYAQADQVLRNILITASRSGLLNNGLQPPFSPDRLTALWSALVADEQVGLGAAQVVGLVGYNSALTLVGRILTEWAAEQRG